MKNFLLVIGMSVALAALIASPVGAIRLNPNTGARSGNQTIQILAFPNTDTSGVTLTLDTLGMTVNSYSDGAGVLTLGSCQNDAKFTSGQVCVSIAKTGGENFSNAEIIGSFEVTITGQNPRIVAASGSEYASGETINGTLATFSDGTPTVLPSTGVLSSQVVFLAVGVIFIFVGGLIGVRNTRSL